MAVILGVLSVQEWETGGAVLAAAGAAAFMEARMSSIELIYVVQVDSCAGGPGGECDGSAKQSVCVMEDGARRVGPLGQLFHKAYLLYIVVCESSFFAVPLNKYVVLSSTKSSSPITQICHHHPLDITTIEHRMQLIRASPICM